MIKTVGSVCSGIEAASVAWETLGVRFEWFSEIADFPSRVLHEKYPTIRNIGDLNNIPSAILNYKVNAPDLICGGTPCQAFSLAGWQNGLNDHRGNLTLKFVDVIEANDSVRLNNGLNRCIILWENVEGVLTDRTNAFGCFISYLAGLSDILEIKDKRWPNAGLIQGPKRNVAWRILDAKFFGLPQQRRRLYLIAGGKDFFPENVLFENHNGQLQTFPSVPLVFEKEGVHFEVFREYTDCLYSAYGTKWNGNAAAYNGSLFVVQDHRIRRLSPLECERLMGFPDNYTNLSGAKKTNRYQAIGNSWAVPVIKWIGSRLVNYEPKSSLLSSQFISKLYATKIKDNELFFNLGKGIIYSVDGTSINCTHTPEDCKFVTINEILCSNTSEDIYISPVGCFGIIRRKRERNLKINPRLEKILLGVSSKMSCSEIEKKSRIQHRGKFSSPLPLQEFFETDSEHTLLSYKSESIIHKETILTTQNKKDRKKQLTLFDLVDSQELS